ncbi:MAG: M81 family metallopeptidase, partial [Pirellulaceae bacterium]
MPHIVIAGLFHETHTFLDDGTSLLDFEIRRGDQLRACTGDSSPMGAALAAFQSWNWNLTIGPDYRAVPSGTVRDEVVDAFWTDFKTAWDPDIDAVFLVLHGAMVSDSWLDVEGEILKRIRELPGASDKPIFGVYDLHANFSAAMAAKANALVAYRRNPHTDAREATVRAAQLLHRHIESGETPSIEHRSARRMWAPTVTGTADDPMRSLEKMARELERDNDSVWAANVAAGFAFADTPDTGVSFQIVTTQPDSDREFLDQLVAKARDFDALVTAADEAMGEVISRVVNDPVAGLTVLVEPSDNIGGGAPGDTTGLLRALVESQIANSAICINDPAAVARLMTRETGTQMRVSIGGKGSRLDAGPLDLDVELLSASEGRFELEDKQSHLASMSGDYFEMGPCVVVRHKGIRILLTSHRTPPFDLGQWRSQGIEPSELSVIVVKAAVAHRQAYDPITARSFSVDTPGPC